MTLTAWASGLTLALGLTTTAAFAQDLPDLGGKRDRGGDGERLSAAAIPDKDGQAVGWEYDAMAEIAKRLNATVKYENISWDAMIPAVSEGQFDLA
jgi:polar amino acid transport system substrate-binding protein